MKCLVGWEPKLARVKHSDGNLAIHGAARGGHIACIEILAQSDVINEPGYNGVTPLHCAVILGHSKAVECLLRLRADVNGGYDKGLRHSPLIDAVTGEHFEVVEILLDAGADKEATDIDKWRPLHFAADRGHTGLARRLLDLGCEPEPEDLDGDTPFMLALLQNRSEIIDLFLARGNLSATAQCLHSGDTCAHYAAGRGRLDVLQQLLDKDRTLFSKVNFDNDDPLTLAAAWGNSAAVELLIRSGISPDGLDVCKESALIQAAWAGSARTVKLLLNLGAKVGLPDQFQRTALLWAVYRGSPRTVNELLKAGANPHVRDAMVSIERSSQDGPFFHCVTGRGGGTFISINRPKMWFR